MPQTPFAERVNAAIVAAGGTPLTAANVSSKQPEELYALSRDTAEHMTILGPFPDLDALKAGVKSDGFPDVWLVLSKVGQYTYLRSVS